MLRQWGKIERSGGGVGGNSLRLAVGRRRLTCQARVEVVASAGGVPWE